MSGSAASRIAVVTGAGSATGIGFAVARVLGHTGLRILIASTTDRILERAADLCREGIEATGVACDLTTENGVAALVAATQGGNQGEGLLCGAAIGEGQERLQAASGLGIHARRAREKAAAPRQPGQVAPRKTKAQVMEQLVASVNVDLPRSLVGQEIQRLFCFSIVVPEARHALVVDAHFLEAVIVRTGVPHLVILPLGKFHDIPPELIFYRMHNRLKAPCLRTFHFICPG